MRRSIAALALAAAALAPAVSAAQTVTAPLGRAVRVPLAGSAADVVVGNPKVADVTVISPTALFVSGKSFGSTNVIVMDRTGRTIFNGVVQVPMSSDGQVSVLRAGKPATYFCAPNCDYAMSKESVEDQTSAAAAMATSATSAPVSAPSASPIAASAMMQ